MSKEEVKEEMKQAEEIPSSNPHPDGPEAVSQEKMMAEVPKADVIITNPTHLAIALLYENKTMEAPHVVAKGRGMLPKRSSRLPGSTRFPSWRTNPWPKSFTRPSS